MCSHRQLSFPPSPRPEPHSCPRNLVQEVHDKCLGTAFCCSFLTRTHSVRHPCLHNCFWSCVDMFLVQSIMKGTEKEEQFKCPAVCSILKIPEWPYQHFLSNDTALRPMCSHVHVQRSLKKCNNSRSMCVPYCKKKYGCIY